MTRFALEQVTDFGDFTGGKDLKEFLKQAYSNISQNRLSDVRVSPDGRHIHVIVRQPNSALLTYDRYLRPHLMQSQKHAALALTRNVPILDVIYIAQSNAEDGPSVLGVIFENGKVEFWKFLECKSGWHLLHTVDLCNSPRAKVISVCMCQKFIIWCEERPPSESSGNVCSNFRYMWILTYWIWRSPASPQQWMGVRFEEGRQSTEDTKCGLELGRINLKREGLLFVNSLDSHSPQMLSETGVFVVTQKELDAKLKPSPTCSEAIDSSAILVEAVFEEACKYYQQRSISSTQLTMEKLKRGGMFQAPISLAAILRDYLSNQRTKSAEKNSSGQERLIHSLESELRSLVLLEDVKTAMVKASDKDLGSYCESLVQQEVCRLLSSEIEKENLQYLNSIFHLFPAESWHAMQAVLHLRCDSEGLLSSKAPAELWKIILSPVQPTANFAHCNGQQKHTTVNVALPVFELLCHSIFKFQPSWLPRFLELAQQQAGTSSTSSWSYGVKESSESLPLYKRALTVLPCKGANQHLQVELLLCSQRPKAVMQALQILMKQGQWEQVTQVAERFCRQSPLLNKEIFSTLLCKVAQHRDLDPYLDLLWTLCPEDMTVSSILNIVLTNLPLSTQNSGPFEDHGSQVTIGLLKPLLRKVLQRETKPSQRYADILQSPSTIPPPTPPRWAKGLSRAGAEMDTELQEPKQRTFPGPQVTSQASPV
ncbi:BLOC-2 complex member HPS6-like [Myxocyprinus asiaticus]|uniref:BLOC-2 complex member HPS6-like n=1 Tax=Myxocyprinus asiaticus TaxID=70543 RepID=UPI0022234809|nr:BLOC-2 complex member HPS6-like [Myxocyprinus asiaticus]